MRSSSSVVSRAILQASAALYRTGTPARSPKQPARRTVESHGHHDAGKSRANDPEPACPFCGRRCSEADISPKIRTRPARRSRHSRPGPGPSSGRLRRFGVRAASAGQRSSRGRPVRPWRKQCPTLTPSDISGANSRFQWRLLRGPCAGWKWESSAPRDTSRSSGAPGPGLPSEECS